MTAAKIKKKIREKAGKYQFAYDKQILEEKKKEAHVVLVACPLKQDQH